MQVFDNQRGTPKFHDLPLAAQLVLWSSRQWLRAFSGGHMIPRCVPQSFAAAGLDHVYAHLTEFLSALAGHELLPEGFGSPNAPRVTAEEIRFVRFLLDSPEASWPFEEPPCPAIARAAAERAERVASSFERAGFRVALRCDLPLEWNPAVESASAAVH